MKNTKYTCNFCGKTHDDSKKMIVSEGVGLVNDICVCSDCISMM